MVEEKLGVGVDRWEVSVYDEEGRRYVLRGIYRRRGIYRGRGTGKEG